MYQGQMENLELLCNDILRSISKEYSFIFNRLRETHSQGLWKYGKKEIYRQVRIRLRKSLQLTYIPNKNVKMPQL